MSASLHSSESGEPNLTPILDMVFQLITFFMLVINFQSQALDATLKLPVVGSAKPIDTGNTDKLLVLNVNLQGKVLLYGGAREPGEYLAKEANYARLELKREGKKVKAGDELPTMVVVRADSSTPFEQLNKVLTDCQKNGFRRFALRAMNKPTGAKS
jgi:biopolymer transport protein ExbD